MSFDLRTWASTISFLIGKGGREGILRLINYYINTNNIIYVDDIEKENNNQISDNKTRKR